MKKTTVSVLLCMLLAVSVSACGGTDKNGSTPAAAETAAEVQESAAEALTSGEEKALSEGLTEKDTERDAAEVSSDADGSGAGERSQSAALPAMHLTVTGHTIETADRASYDNRTFPLARESYTTIEPDEEMQRAYPELTKVLTERSETDADNAMEDLARMSGEAEEGVGTWLLSSMSVSWDTVVERADAHIYSELSCIDVDFNGPHPGRYWVSHAFDPETGEEILLKDVVSDMAALPQILLDNLESDAGYELAEEDLADILPRIESKLEVGVPVWTLEEDGFHMYFDAYDLMYYAVGPFQAAFSYEEYPGLIREEYLPVSGETPVADRVQYEMEETVYIPTEDIEILQQQIGLNGIDEDKIIGEDDFIEQYFPEWEGEDAAWEEENSGGFADAGDAGSYVIENPGWAYYTASGVTNGGIRMSPWSFREVAKDKLNSAEAWAGARGYELPADVPNAPAYTVGDYFYYADVQEEGRVALELRDAVTHEPEGLYDFGAFAYPSDGDEEGLFAGLTVTKILYAEVYDGILYAALGHRTYANVQPHTAYIVAVDISSGRVLWRSDDQVANAHNFLIGDDIIICGYGFTDEEDYMYVLNRHDGSILESYPLDSKPDYLIPEDDSLYVLTYRSAYEFNVVYNE